MRGGARPGCGRKPENRKAVSYKLRSETIEDIGSLAEARGLSRTRVIEMAIEKMKESI